MCAVAYVNYTRMTKIASGFGNTTLKFVRTIILITFWKLIDPFPLFSDFRLSSTIYTISDSKIYQKFFPQSPSFLLVSHQNSGSQKGEKPGEKWRNILSVDLSRNFLLTSVLITRKSRVLFVVDGIFNTTPAIGSERRIPFPSFNKIYSVCMSALGRHLAPRNKISTFIPPPRPPPPNSLALIRNDREGKT